MNVQHRIIRLLIVLAFLWAILGSAAALGKTQPEKLQPAARVATTPAGQALGLIVRPPDHLQQAELGTSSL